MQVAYIDESQSSNLLMAGFISTVEKWAEFSQAWKKELDSQPKIQFFHMNEVLKKHSGVFGNAPLPERIEKVTRLIAIINKWTETDFSCSMKLESYDRILKPTLNHFKKLRRFDHPYLWLFVVGILEGLSSVEIYGRKGSKIRFVFDKNGSLFDKARRRYEEFSEFNAFVEAKTIVDTVEEKDDKVFMPLQAADLLAWNINRARSKPPEGDDPLNGYGLAVSNLRILTSVKRESWTLEYKDEALHAANRAINAVLGSNDHTRKS